MVRQWPCGAKPRRRCALRAPATQRCHVGLDPGLIDKDQAPRIEAGLPRSPAAAPAGDVGASLLKGEQRFFES